MKIAYILDTYPSLTETFIAREIEALRRRGLQIDVYALNAGEGARLIEPLSIVSRSLSKLESLRSGEARVSYYTALGQHWWRQGSLSGLFEGVRHIHAGWASHPAFIAQGAATASGLLWSFSGHARDVFVEGSFLSAKLRTAKFATACTLAGEQVLKHHSPHAPEKVIYAPHGIEVATYTFKERDLNQEMHILSVGRLVEKKGFSLLLEALDRLKQEGHAFKATIVGDGPLFKSLTTQSQRLGLQGMVTLLGAQSHQQVKTAMQSANCFVVPSIVAADGDRDGLPNVILEAAASGVPIVGTSTGGITDFLDESTGRLGTPNNAASLASRILEVFRDQTSTVERSRAARQRVEELFDVDKNVEKLAQAFAS